VKPDAMTSLDVLSHEDKTLCERIRTEQEKMLERTLKWASTNTGSWNRDGLETLAPDLADAFSVLDADTLLLETEPFERINSSGEVDEFQTGPIIRVNSRPEAPIQVIMSGHYDTVFPPGSFTEITDLGDGKINGPGVCDMKGGISISTMETCLIPPI